MFNDDQSSLLTICKLYVATKKRNRSGCFLYWMDAIGSAVLCKACTKDNNRQKRRDDNSSVCAGIPTKEIFNFQF